MELILNLSEKAAARRSSGKVQECLDRLASFWKHEAVTLATLRKAARSFNI